MEELKEKGLTKRLRGFELLERGIPRQHCEIVNAKGENYWRSNIGYNVNND